MKKSDVSIDESWDALFQQVVDHDLGLFIGAGLSTGNDFPDWASLTGDLSGTSRADVVELVAGGVPLTSQLGIARQEALEGGGTRAWIERVRKALYKNFYRQLETHELDLELDLRLMEHGTPSHDAVRVFFEKTNRSLVEIVSMCAVRGTEPPDPRIVAVLTTNLDSLMQVCDRALHGSARTIRTIERATKSSEAGKVSLYHLHGYLTPHPDTHSADEAADRLILTEADYVQRNDNPNHWAATTLHWVLRECPVLFVGCSMNDELIRRALFRTRRDRLVDIEAEREDRRATLREPKHFAILERPSRPEIRDALIKSYRLMDVKPLWVREWRHLPRHLRELREQLARWG